MEDAMPLGCAFFFLHSLPAAVCMWFHLTFATQLPCLQSFDHPPCLLLLGQFVERSTVLKLVLLVNENSQAPPRSAESEPVKLGPSDVCVNKLFRGFWYPLKLRTLSYRIRFCTHPPVLPLQCLPTALKHTVIIGHDTCCLPQSHLILTSMSLFWMFFYSLEDQPVTFFLVHPNSAHTSSKQVSWPPSPRHTPKPSFSSLS